ncbi:hypothetical protein BV898_17733 [Hypsibius exemplaris]|uniref:Putative auto-transporter adhesin head GIN domain-containing protein n=1 Tax=Hypsibius exemplaris TaxID=2072580 RepID=A0A9X6RMC1_HYPEX|nr:hypothetical protein BV898_17733 [Hypsibius exemplaris]
MMAKPTVCSIALVLLSLFQLGAATSESRDVRQYTGVGGWCCLQSVHHHQRPGRRDRPRADEAILALVETVVVDGILVVRFKPPSVREDSIRLVSQGSSSIQLAVESSLVIANLQGSSILDVSGSATAGQITAQGSSQFNGLDLRLTTAQVTGQGSSQIAIAVSTSVTGSLHGSAQVQLRGQPQVQIQRSGAANVLNV